MQFGVIRKLIAFPNFRKDFLSEEPDIAITEAVVFVPPIGGSIVGHRLGFVVTGIKEDGNRRRHLTRGDQIVEDHRNPPAAPGVPHAFAVLENHKSGGLFRAVLTRNVNGPLPGCSREDF